MNFFDLSEDARASVTTQISDYMDRMLNPSHYRKPATPRTVAFVTIFFPVEITDGESTINTEGAYAGNVLPSSEVLYAVARVLSRVSEHVESGGEVQISEQGETH